MNTTSDLLKSMATTHAVVAGAKLSPSFEEKLQEVNFRHSRNGDPVSFLLESLNLKLTHNRLNLVTNEEIEVLAMEIKSARQLETINVNF